MLPTLHDQNRFKIFALLLVQTKPFEDGMNKIRKNNIILSSIGITNNFSGNGNGSHPARERGNGCGAKSQKVTSLPTPTIHTLCTDHLGHKMGLTHTHKNNPRKHTELHTEPQSRGGNAGSAARGGRYPARVVLLIIIEYSQQRRHTMMTKEGEPTTDGAELSEFSGKES